MTKKRIFITGAAGFIGYHMAHFLHKRGDAVLGYDNFNDYYDPRLKQARVEQLSLQGISVLKGDVIDRHTLQKAIEDHQTTHILHLAAQAGQRDAVTTLLELGADPLIQDELHGGDARGWAHVGGHQELADTLP